MTFTIIIDILTIMYVDGPKLLCRIFADGARLQRPLNTFLRALNTFLRWCEGNKLSLNIYNCRTLKRAKWISIIIKLIIILLHVAEYKDLGLLSDSKCSFVAQLNQLILSVSNMKTLLVLAGAYRLSTLIVLLIVLFVAH